MMYYPKKSKVIKIDLFDLGILLINSKNQLKEYIEKNKIPKSVVSLKMWIQFNGLAKWAECGGVDFFFIIIREKQISTIAHEASHMADYIMQCFAIKDDEIRAYLVGYITKEICRLLNLQVRSK